MPRASKSAESATSRARRGRGYGAMTVYEALRREILTLQIEPNTLLDETELAERFKLSRSPVREALIRLSAEGLVTTLRNRSSVVASFDIVAVPSYLDAVQLLYRVTTRLAALNRSAEQLETIKRVQKEHETAARRGDPFETIRLNREFHAAIADATGNAFFAGWTRSLLDQGQRILGLYLHSSGEVQLKDAILDHVAIVRAIEARDADTAEEAGRRDADIIATRLQARLTQQLTANVRIAAARGR